MSPHIDYLKTLTPEAGIARAVYLYAPDGGQNLLWVLGADIGQSDLRLVHQQTPSFNLSLVGAADTRRSRVYARAAGEAVERFALLPPVVSDAIPAVIRADGGATWNGDLAGRVVDAVEGHHITDGGVVSDVFVPLGAVNYPAAVEVEEGLFDPSPSGTASGTSRGDAVERACKEVLERHAAMKAWIERSPLDQVDVDGVATRSSEFAQLASRARGIGLELVFAYLCPADNHPQPIMCMLLDESGELACAGLGLERDDAHGAFRALQEALQVRTVLLTPTTTDLDAHAPTAVSDDEERAAYWGSSHGLKAAKDWHRLVSRTPRPLAEPHPSVSWSTLVGERIEVDLTHRLPQPVRDMGWCVVKVLSARLQPLRMSDVVLWNIVNPEGYPLDQLPAAPHPYI